MKSTMRRMLVGGLIAAGVISLPGPRAFCQEVPGSGWARLPGGTAWILLGDIDVATGHWGTLHRLVAVTGQPLDPGRIPHHGEVLQVTHDVPLIIHDYARRGEAFATSPPVDPDWQRDLTGAVLKPGARVVVEEIWNDSDVTNLQAVYARVTPAVR
jgi:hypothetical protein